MSNLTWTVGNARVTSIIDQEGLMPIRMLIPKATATALAPHIDWLIPQFLDEKGRCTLPTRAMVIESSGKRIIVDTGWGTLKIPGYEWFVGSSSLLENLAGAGFSCESIDIVLCTHMHVDHVGRHTIQSGSHWVPTFPNARYIFVRKEWEYWNAAPNRNLSENFNETVRPIVSSGLADLVDTDCRVTDEVRLEPTPGHTPGHVSVHISSGGNEAVVLGDVTHHPVQWAEPDWGLSADCDSLLAVQTRKRMRAQYVNTKTLLIGPHYPSYCAGYLVSSEGYVRFQKERP